MSSSARRALRILDIVNRSAEPIGVTAIAEALHTLPGTAYRSLDALERCEFVARYRASTSYEVGAAAKRLRHTLFAQFPIRNLAIPFLRRLAFASNETVSISVAVGWQMLRLAVVGGRRAVRNVAGDGLAGLLDEETGGRALLAGLDGAALKRFLGEAPLPASGVRDVAKLRVALKEIKRTGYAIEDISPPAHHGAVSVPVRYKGKTIAAIGIEGPVCELATGTMPDDWPDWLAIIAELESQIDAVPTFSEGPFAHLDPAKLAATFQEKPLLDEKDEED